MEIGQAGSQVDFDPGPIGREGKKTEEGDMKCWGVQERPQND